ncbi:MAG: OmpA family protein [Cyclobacteriaceae bacterium]
MEKKGDEEFFYNNYTQASKTYFNALQLDTSNVLLKLKIADTYRHATQFELAKDWYEKAFATEGRIDAVHKLNFSKVLIFLGFEAEAKKMLLEYQEERGPDPLVTAQLKGLMNLHDFEKNSSRYAVKAVNFNSSGMDFSPFSYGSGIVFVSSRPRKRGVNADVETFLSLFYTEESEDGTFSEPVALDGGNNSSYHEGPAVFFDNGNRRIFSRNSLTKSNKLKDGSVNTLVLAQSERTASGKWTEPVILPFGGPEYSVAHPAVSTDGTTLYFSSNIPGTFGESDLFVSKFENGLWSQPRNLGAAINTPGRELFPSLYNDSILFFSSDGHSGMGGLDLFFCNLSAREPTVTNFGAPVNSRSDDFGVVMEHGSSSGFFSSNRAGGVGADDIYFFEEIQPYAEIQLYDSLTRHYISEASLILSKGGVIVGQTRSDLTGEAEFRLSSMGEYTLSISAPGYKSVELALNPALWPVNQQAQIKVYLNPLKSKIEGRLSVAVHTRERSKVTNVISFTSSPLDVDLVAESASRPAETVDPVLSDSIAAPFLKVIVIEIINDLPAIIIAKNDSIHEMKLVSGSVLANSSLNLEIAIPRGAKRNDFEAIIREQILAQGYGISRFLLIRSFFFDSGKTWVRNDACAQLDKIIEVMLTYPQIDLEMIFHSDSRGTESFNLDLSKARSEEVKHYLKLAGIQVERIITRFVGEGQLLNDCGDLSDCGEMLHQINRTAEFKFIIR